MNYFMKRFLTGILLATVGTIAATLVADVKAESPQDAHAVSSAPVVNSGSDREACLTQSAIDDLRSAREKVEQKEKELAARELELKALETAAQEELQKLQQARADILKMDELRKKENEGKVAKIVATVETMSPKSAAQLIAALDEPLATIAIQKMDTVKLAKIMNVMEPGKSSRLTELLAGVNRSIGAGNLKQKGGEKDGGKREFNSNNVGLDGAAPKPAGRGDQPKAGG